MKSAKQYWSCVCSVFSGAGAENQREHSTCFTNSSTYTVNSIPCPVRVTCNPIDLLYIFPKIALKNNTILALASVAQLVGMLSHTLKSCRFDSRSGHIPGCRFDPPVGVHKRKQPIDVSLSLSLFSLLLSLSLKTMSSGED